jgi:Ohr subfamily peroxiredoxin
MPVLYTTEAVATGDGRNGEVRTADGVFDELLAIPTEMGGPGGDKTNPEQLFAAGYAACFHNGLRVIAREQGLTLAGSTVRAAVSLVSLHRDRFTLAVTLTAHLPGLDQATADKLVDATHHVCPYSNATRGNVEVTLRVTV